MPRAARVATAEALRKAFPKWRVVDDHATPDALDRMTIYVSATGVGRLTEAPIGSYDVTVTLHLVSPKKDDFPVAERDLEGALDQLLDFLDQQFGTAWEPATLTTFLDTYLAWQVPLHIITNRGG